jgi:hypothetical protein
MSSAPWGVRRWMHALVCTSYNARAVEEGLRFGGSADDKLWRSDQAWWGTMANSQSKISSAIETSREELLDLGLRNPLLNYRSSRARGVEVVDELPAEVFRILVREGRPMSFEAALQLVSVSSFQVFTDGQWCTVRSIASSGCAELCS